MTFDSQTLTALLFQSEVGHTFIAQTVPEPVELQLLRVVEGRRTSTDFRSPFSLIFTSPWSVLLMEAQYLLKSASGREYMLHLCPIVSPPGGLRHYQASFN